MKGILIRLPSKPDLTWSYFITVGHARIDTRAWPSQRCLIPLAFAFLGCLKHHAIKPINSDNQVGKRGTKCSLIHSCQFPISLLFQSKSSIIFSLLPDHYVLFGNKRKENYGLLKKKKFGSCASNNEEGNWESTLTNKTFWTPLPLIFNDHPRLLLNFTKIFSPYHRTEHPIRQ